METGVIVLAVVRSSSRVPEYISLSRSAAAEIGFVRTHLSQMTVTTSSPVVRWICDNPSTYAGAEEGDSLHRFVLLAENSDSCRNWLDARGSMGEVQRDLAIACRQLCDDLGASDMTTIILEAILSQKDLLDLFDEETPLYMAFSVLSGEYRAQMIEISRAADAAWKVCGEIGLIPSCVLRTMILAVALDARTIYDACMAAIVDTFPQISDRDEWASPHLARIVPLVLAAVPPEVLARCPVSPALITAMRGGALNQPAPPVAVQHGQTEERPMLTPRSQTLNTPRSQSSLNPRSPRAAARPQQFSSTGSGAAVREPSYSSPTVTRRLRTDSVGDVKRSTNASPYLDRPAAPSMAQSSPLAVPGMMLQDNIPSPVAKILVAATVSAAGSLSRAKPVRPETKRNREVIDLASTMHVSSTAITTDTAFNTMASLAIGDAPRKTKARIPTSLMPPSAPSLLQRPVASRGRTDVRRQSVNSQDDSSFPDVSGYEDPMDGYSVDTEGAAKTGELPSLERAAQILIDDTSTLRSRVVNVLTFSEEQVRRACAKKKSLSPIGPLRSQITRVLARAATVATVGHLQSADPVLLAAASGIQVKKADLGRLHNLRFTTARKVNR